MLLLAPGQGSQSAGMLEPWLKRPDALETVSRWSEVAGLDLLDLGTRVGAQDLRPTQVAQPMLVATALLSARALLDGGAPQLVCGHSVGELAAAALAGVITDEQAVALAAGRGRLMAEAAALAPTGMAALLGASLDELDAAELESAGLELATVNAPGQVVVGGPVEALESYRPARGRVRRLDVAGAFHTAAMRPAVEEFRALVAALEPAEPLCPVVANADGELVRDGREALDRLVDQLVRPVRFDLCLQTCAAQLADGARAVELAPGGVLTGIAKRAAPSLGVVALTSPADLASTGVAA